MNSESIKNSFNDCPNSKLEIKANNYNKSKTFNVQESVDKHLSRVDSQNDPDVTENLDNIARKMGINQSNNNSRPTMKVKLNKLDRCSEEKLNEKDISKSFQIPNNKLSEVTASNKSTPKKTSFMSNIIRRLSISTPKILSKNRKSKSRRSKQNRDNVDNVDNQKDETNGNGKLANMDAIEDNPKPSQNGKSIKNILHKLAKRKVKTKITSEPPSSIESRPSLSSVVNHGLNHDTTTSCNDIYLNKISRNEFPNYDNCASVDCILDYAKQKKLMKHRESNSSTSEDLIEQEVKLNAGVNPLSNDVISDEFPDLENTSPQTDIDKISPLSIKTSEFKFESQRSCHSTISGAYHTDSSKVKLTLALYGYSNYGLSSSRLTSKSCMEFRSHSNTDKVKLSMENIPMDKATEANEAVDTIEKIESNQEVKVENENIRSNINGDKELEVKDTEVKENEINEVQIRPSESNENNEQSNVVLRKSQRPHDIKIRKSREPSQTLVARSSMIMLVVAHNSPRNKIISNQLVTPNKDLDLNASLNGSVNIPAVKLNFESFSNKDPKSPNYEMSSVETNSEVLPANRDGTSVEPSANAIENGFTTEPNEICNGNYFLNLVHKHENEILMKIDVVQKYLDTENLKFDDEVSGQLLVTVGKARLLLSEKMLQFKGLCEKNISGIIEENELPTLLSDLNGFWDMVFGQIEDIYKNFALVEKIRLNDWKMVTFDENDRPSTNTPARSKRSTTSKTSIGSQRKSSATNTPLAMKKKQSSDTPTHSKYSSAEKRKNMMQFKLNQKANMVQNSDPTMNNDITFY